MKQIWNRISAALSKDWPSIVESMNGPVEFESWHDFEDAIGVSLPKSFKEFYAVINGEMSQRIEDVPTGLIFGQQLLPQSAVIAAWEEWKEIVDENSEEELEEDFMESASFGPGMVKKIYANKRWIPFTSDNNGNHFGLDLDPGDKGIVGQVISFGADVETKYVLAPGFGAFVEWFASQLESKSHVVQKRHVSDDYPTLVLKGDSSCEVAANKHFYGKPENA